jgi:predicted ATPase/DNA-binding CsgD family transcriptional regulator
VAARPPTDEMAIRVRALRDHLGVSQEQLAHQLRVSFATVNRWEGGRHRMSNAGRARFELLERVTNSMPAAPSRPPDPLASFVGRDDAVVEVIDLIGRQRLVTLTGPAGIGKTRLATEVCRRQSIVTGAGFVDLAGVVDPQEVEARVTAAFNAAPHLLALDAVECCTGPVRELVRRLLAGSTDLHVLVTSQRPVGVSGEQVWPVPSLGCPPVAGSVADVLGSAAGRLFVDRAAKAAPHFVLTDDTAPAAADLCRVVEGLPLAIETLAGWAGTLSVGQILDRHRDLLYPEPEGTTAPDQDRTESVRSAVAGSWQRLDERDQGVVASLSIFAGSFTLDDAAVVAKRSEIGLLAATRRLVDCSWLIVESGHPVNSYRMMNALRLFAFEQLVRSEHEQEVRARHARHFAALAGASEHGLAGVDRTEWVVRMTQAGVDVDAALAWAARDGDDLLGLEMSSALWLWWLTTGRLSDGRRWVSDFLRRAHNAPADLTARAECAAAVLAVESGDYVAAVEQATRALAGFELMADRDGAARAATALGSAERYIGRQTCARHYFELAMNLRRDLGDDRGLASALNNMALLALDGGDLVETRALFEESLLVKRRLGEPRTVAIGLANLSDVLIRASLVSQALGSLVEAAGIAADLGDTQLLATIACNLGDAAAIQGDYLEAIDHYQTSLDAYRASGGAHDLVPALCGMARALHTLGRTLEAVVRLREAEMLSTVSANAEHLAEIRSALADIGHATTIALPGGLTARQAQILRQVASGASNKSVAETLHISVATVERHLATIYRKLGLHGRVDAARYALKHGLAMAGTETVAPAPPEYMIPRISN